MTAPRARVGVLASGGGSNLGAMLEYADRLAQARAFDVALVTSDRPNAGAIGRAAARGIPSAVVAPNDDDALLELLSSHAIDLIVLAGYLRLVPPRVTAAWRGRLLNIHPALLPAFGGAGMFGKRVHRAVLESGARVTGATVHFVDEAYDRGAIIAQWPVPVFAQDSAETLAARVLRTEHALLPRVVDAVASGQIRLSASGAVEGHPPGAPPEDAGFVWAQHAEQAGIGLDALQLRVAPRRA